MKILSGYDGSEFADAALEDLQRAGLGTQLEGCVMTVADVFVPPPIDEEVENIVPMYVPPELSVRTSAQSQLVRICSVEVVRVNSK